VVVIPAASSNVHSSRVRGQAGDPMTARTTDAAKTSPCTMFCEFSSEP